MKRVYHPFEPFIDEESKILILGTFASIKSFENNFYYTHKRNQFWKLLSIIFNSEFPKEIEDKKRLLRENRIALWDMIKSCKRRNSLDSNLKEIELNKIDTLLLEYPKIEKIYFTSKKALLLYKKNFNLNREIYYLPSPSPTYAIKSFEEKLKIWKKLLKGKK